MPDLKEIIYREALANAYEFNGKGNPDSVVKRVMSSYPEARKQAKTLIPLIRETVEKVNSMSFDAIKQELLHVYPDYDEKQKAKKVKQKQEGRKRELPELPGAVKGKVVLRYAPDPSKFPHLGHGLNYMINYIYAKKYDAKVFLRFDDTNPGKVQGEINYYDKIKEGLKWLGITYDKELHASDHIEEMYDAARRLIKEGHLYACTCSGEDVKSLRMKGKACEHHLNTNPDHHLELFEKAVNSAFEAGEIIIRLRGDMSSKNTTLRDPIMFRVPKDPSHPRVGNKFKLWPTYDFESPFMEHKLGITHVLRSSEFGTMRIEQQSLLIKLLGGTPPVFFQYSRYNLVGFPTKGRIIRELVEQGKVEGWDDIRLITLKGLEKRGIAPQVIHDLVMEVGVSASQTSIDWSLIEALNRKYYDPQVKRFFAVLDPWTLHIQSETKNLPDTITLPFHPDQDLGSRVLHVTSEMYVSGKDVSRLKPGMVFRLKDLCNVRVLESNPSERFLLTEYAGKELIQKSKKIQWVPKESAMRLEFLVTKMLQATKSGDILPETLKKQFLHGFIEPSIQHEKIGAIVQLERIGFAKLNKKSDALIKMHLIHK